MKCSFEKVVDGITQYINKEICPGMNDVQDFAARVLMGRIIKNQENIKIMLIDNGIIRTFGIIDGEGLVDITELAEDIKKELEKKEKITLTVPWFGKMTFTMSDVDVLYKLITGEEMQNNENN